MKLEAINVFVHLGGQERTVNLILALVKTIHVKTMQPALIFSKIISVSVHQELMENNVKQLQKDALETHACMEVDVKTLDLVLTALVLKIILVLVVSMNMMLVKLEHVRMEQLVLILVAVSSVSVHLDTQANSVMKTLLIARKIHVHHLLLVLISQENITASVHLI